MRLFLIWPGQYQEAKKLILRLQKAGHRIIYWVGLGGEEEDKFPEIIFHDHNEAGLGLPAEGVNSDEFPPLGEDLIKKWQDHESSILTMMNKKFGRLCVDERRHIYYNMLRYWHGLVSKHKPDIIVFNTVPHTVYNYIIYELAKFLGIETIMFEDSWVSDRLLLYTDWRKGCLPLQKELEKNRGKNFSLEDLSSDLQEHYKRHTQSRGDSTPIYMKIWKKQFSRRNVFFNKLRTLIGSIKDGTVLKKVSHYIKREFGPNLKREYLSLELKPDFEKSFIYVPLSFQPERTTSPMGDVFVDQLLMIELLSYCLPNGWLLFVKEHPSQWWLGGKVEYFSSRYPGYYQRIAQIKNVRIVPVQTNTYQLINRAKAVAVVTGNAGFEALLRGKPALVFGYAWFRDCPVAFRVNNVETCRTALAKIARGFKVRSQDVINYLRCFGQTTTHAFLEPFLEKVSRLSREESMDNITQLIISEVSKMA